MAKNASYTNMKMTHSLPEDRVLQRNHNVHVTVVVHVKELHVLLHSIANLACVLSVIEHVARRLVDCRRGCWLRCVVMACIKEEESRIVKCYGYSTSALHIPMITSWYMTS